MLKMAPFLSYLFLWNLQFVLFLNLEEGPLRDSSTYREKLTVLFLTQVPLAMLSDFILILL